MKKTRVYYITPGQRPKLARGPKGVPPEAVWSGPVLVGYEGDLLEAWKKARAEWYTKWREWLAYKKWLTKKVATAAPAFKDHAKRLLEKCLVSEPKLAFTYTERPIETDRRDPAG